MPLSNEIQMETKFEYISVAKVNDDTYSVYAAGTDDLLGQIKTDWKGDATFHPARGRNSVQLNGCGLDCALTLDWMKEIVAAMDELTL